MTIGEVLDRLSEFVGNEPVYFDFCNRVPTGVGSWRGIYSEPALGWGESTTNDFTVTDLIKILEEAISGKKFGGYKGNQFTYSRESPLHVDNYGECTDTEIKSIKSVGDRIIIKTKYVPS